MAIVVIEHGPSSGGERLTATLRDYGHPLRLVRLHRGEPLPVDLDDVEGVVTTGGPQSVGDGDPWLEPEKALLRQADQEALPIVGVCLGCQVLASALGGEVRPLEGGIELGWHDVMLTPTGAEDPIFAGIAWTSMQLHWHRDCVAKAPPGARVLAKSQRCPIQAWARGLRTYGFQYHPEVTPATIERWAAKDPRYLAEAGITLDQLRAQTQAVYPAFERLSQRLFTSIAMLLAPADKLVRGVARDLHH